MNKDVENNETQKSESRKTESQDTSTNGGIVKKNNMNPEESVAQAQKTGTHTPGPHQKSEVAREGSGEQSHENRANPEKDHTPGHMGYTRENLENVNPTRREP